MYCDKCGTPFVTGAQFCTACGKQIVAGATAAGPARGVATGYRAATAGGAGDGRVGRNMNLLAGLWAASGILRLMGLGWLLIFRRFFDWGWPFGNWGLHSLFSVGLFSGGVFLAGFGVVHLLLAWGLLERQPWARMLGIVLGILALIRFPFGTALGIYTLWVLAPEGSGREWETLAGVRAPVTVAR